MLILSVLDIQIIYVSKIAKNAAKPDQLEAMLAFYRSESGRLEFMSIAREIGLEGGTIEQAIEVLKSSEQEVGKNSTNKKNTARREILSKGLDRQWGLRTTSQVESVEPEEASDLPEIIAGPASEKPAATPEDDPTEGSRTPADEETSP